MERKVRRDETKQIEGENTSKLTNKQKIIKAANALRKDNRFIVSKIEKGQQKTFKCPECGESFDLSKSVEYGAAVEMFEKRNGMCVGCYYKKTGVLLY